MEFKVGDLVRFKKDLTNWNIRDDVDFNKVYKVIEIELESGRIWVGPFPWYSYRFEKVNREEKLKRILNG